MPSRAALERQLAECEAALSRAARRLARDAACRSRCRLLVAQCQAVCSTMQLPADEAPVHQLFCPDRRVAAEARLLHQQAMERATAPWWKRLDEEESGEVGGEDGDAELGEDRLREVTLEDDLGGLGLEDDLGGLGLEDDLRCLDLENGLQYLGLDDDLAGLGLEDDLRKLGLKCGLDGLDGLKDGLEGMGRKDEAVVPGPGGLEREALSRHPAELASTGKAGLLGSAAGAGAPAGGQTAAAVASRS